MKKLLLLVLILSSVITKAQSVTLDSTDNVVEFTKTVRVPGASQQDLYYRARKWYAKTFLANDLTIRLADKESGNIIGRAKGYSFYDILFTNMTYVVNYTVSVSVKDHEYKLTITDYEFKDDETGRKTIAKEFIKKKSLMRKDGSFKRRYSSYYITMQHINLALSEQLKKAMDLDEKYQADY